MRNVERHIGEMVQSVLAQTYRDWELIIMDGRSSDDTLQAIKRHAAEDPRIRVYSERDEGPWHAVDKMFDLARGEFITIVCGQDGFLDQNWLETSANILERDKAVSLVWALSRERSEEGVLSPDVHVSYSHLIAAEGPSHGMKHILRKIYEVLRDLLFGSWERKKFLLAKIFSPNAPFRLKLLAKRELKGGVPQKEQWFDYWLDTALVFPDQSMVVAKRVFLECVPRYKKGEKTLGYLTDFYFNFHARGYLPHFIPTFATFGRMHESNSAARGGRELHERFQEYLDRVRRLRDDLKRGRTTVVFCDRYGNPIANGFSR